jgi:HEAT repeat protein
MYKISALFCIGTLLMIGSSAVTPAGEQSQLPDDVSSLTQLLHDQNCKIRARAANRLGTMGEKAKAAVPQLIAMLADEDVTGHAYPFIYKVYGYASIALQRIGLPAVPGLTQALKNPNERVRARAAEALGGIGARAKNAIPALLNVSKDDPCERVRSEAVKVLRKIDPSGAMTTASFVRLARTDTASQVRCRAFAALEEIDRNTKRAIPVFIQGLKDEDPNVRGLVARVLGRYGPKAKSAVPALRNALSDQAYRHHGISIHLFRCRPVRYDVAESLGKIGADARAALPDLRRMLNRDADGEVRVAAAMAILRIDPGAKDPVPGLIAVLQDDQQGGCGRELAADGLAELGPAAVSALPALKKTLGDEDHFLRMSTVQALVAIGGKEMVPLLVKQMQEEKRQGDKIRAKGEPYCNNYDNIQTRSEIAVALGKLGRDAVAAVPALSAALAEVNEGYDVPVAAAEALGKIGSAARAAVPQLVIALDDEYEEMRAKAALALGRIGPGAKAAVPRLGDLLNDPSEDVREAARNALRKIDPEAARQLGSERPTNNEQPQTPTSPDQPGG